jgi:nucleotide-binding universal stress UspA family protein
MKDIAVLVDYTDGCRKALNQTRILAELAGSNIHVVNVTSREITDAEHARLSAFATEELGVSLPMETHLADGRVLTSLRSVLEEIDLDLIVLCTHGVKGITQQLFGARILSLVQSLEKSFLVVQENSEIREEGVERILFPATLRPQANVLIGQVMSLAAECDSEVVLYEINGSEEGVEKEIRENFDAAKKMFKAKGIRFREVKETTNNHSKGFAGQTLDYALKNGIDVIATPSEAMDRGFLMTKSDKELLLTNEHGIPVLACG